MKKNGIAIIYDDDTIMYISSYSYMGSYHPKWGDELDSKQTKICFTDNLDNAFEWEHKYQIDTAYKLFCDCMKDEKDIKHKLKFNSDVFRRYVKIKTLKEKCQKTN